MKKRTEKDIKQEVERILEEIDILKEKARQRGLSFRSLTKEELVKKIRGESSNSPFYYSQAWVSGTSRGGPANFRVWIHNPDNRYYHFLYVSIFFGVANFLDDIGEGLNGRDTRWPYLSTESFSLSPGASTSIALDYTVPTDVPLSTYMGNSVLWEGKWNDKGVYLDRSLFEVTLVQ